MVAHRVPAIHRCPYYDNNIRKQRVDRRTIIKFIFGKQTRLIYTRRIPTTYTIWNIVAVFIKHVYTQSVFIILLVLYYTRYDAKSHRKIQ